MGIPAVRPSKTLPKLRDPDVGRLGTGQVISFCSVLGLASLPVSVVIGSLMGGAGGILMALAISGVIVLLFGSIALTLVALGTIADMIRGLWGGVARHGMGDSGGVGDEWLDGLP